MSDSDLPLLDLFCRLRYAGLLLGMQEYLMLLRALEAGFGLPDQASLLRLCKTIWTKSDQEERLLEHCFEQLVIRRQALPEKFADYPELGQQTRIGNDGDPPIASAYQQHLKPTEHDIAPNVDVVQALKTEITASQASFTTLPSKEADYFPASSRQMQQAWRYLRRSARRGAATEVDVERTITITARQGVFLGPVYVPQNTNLVWLVLLIDHGGSMVPFRTLASRLTESAMRGGRLDRANAYYFHDCPGTYVYADQGNQTPVVLTELLDELARSSACILIVSDAGAARGGFDDQRIDATEKCISLMREKVRRIAWLNPVPEDRWMGTTAEVIAEFVSMHQLDRQGLHQAVDVLRGRVLATLV